MFKAEPFDKLIHCGPLLRQMPLKYNIYIYTAAFGFLPSPAMDLLHDSCPT